MLTWVGNMTDQVHRLAVVGSLRDVLRALECEKDDWEAGSDLGSPQSLSAAPSTALVTRLEHLPSSDDEVFAAGWRDRLEHWSPAAVMAMAVPVMGLLFFASLFATPTGAEWDWDGRSEVKLEKTNGGAANVTGEQKPQGSGIRAFAMLGQRALTARAADLFRPISSSSLSAEPVFTVRPGETVSLPFSVTDSGTVPEGAKVFVRGVPEYAALSAAEPQADGTWAVPVDRLGDVKLTAYALPAEQSNELTGELRSPGGEVLGRASTTLTAAQAPSVAPIVGSEPSAQPAEPAGSEGVTVTVPLPGTQILTFQDPGQSPAGGAPGWMQPWNGSALSGGGF